MRWLGEMFPVLMVIVGLYDLWRSFGEASGTYAIAAAVLFGAVLVAGRLRQSGRGAEKL